MSDKVEWIRRYEVDSFQAYFAASLELQEELINNGFHVPMSNDGSIKTPIPIIYSNFRGWIRSPDPITIERVIPPEWLNLSAQSLGWIEVKFKGKRAFHMPKEEVYVDIGYDDAGNIHLRLDVKGYHLERASIRGVNPEKWTNWVMFYVATDLMEDLLRLLRDLTNVSTSRTHLRVKKEIQQSGKEITYYAFMEGREEIGVPLRYFSFCMGCFPLVLRYLRIKADEHKLDASVINKLKLRIEPDPKVNTGLKIGVAKIAGKRTQIMFKLASNTPKRIRGVLKPVIDGKARGKLVECDHKTHYQYIVVDTKLLYHALALSQLIE